MRSTSKAAPALAEGGNGRCRGRVTVQGILFARHLIFYELSGRLDHLDLYLGSPMSHVGQKRSSQSRTATSDLPRSTDIVRPAFSRTREKAFATDTRASRNQICQVLETEFLMRSGYCCLVVSAWLALGSAAFADDRAAHDPRGQWLRADGVARVNVAPCGPDLCMTNVWIRPGVSDEKVGDYIRFDVKLVSPGRLKGTGYNQRRDLAFSTDIYVAGDAMTTGGCLVGGLICKSTPWTRVP